MNSELDESMSFYFLLTRQIRRYPTKKNYITQNRLKWKFNLDAKLIQDSPSPRYL